MFSTSGVSRGALIVYFVSEPSHDQQVHLSTIVCVYGIYYRL